MSKEQNNSSFRIGTKVRFLNATGGGVVTGFDGRKVVVEDEDGFPSSYSPNELVVVDVDTDTKLANSVSPQTIAIATGATTMSLKQRMKVQDEEMEEEEEEEEAIFFPQSEQSKETNEVPFVTEDLDTEEGERLTVFLAFESQDLEHLGVGGYVAYLVNDSNYALYYIISTIDDTKVRVQSHGMIESHTKYEFATIDKSAINQWGKVSVQLLAFKPKKAFESKPAYSVNVKVTPVRFFQRGSFKPSDFFDEDVLTVNVVNNDVPENNDFAQQLIEMFKESNTSDASVVSEQKSKPEVMVRPKATTLAKRVVETTAQEEPIVVDLHADKLIGDVSGMQAEEILSLQIAEMRKVMEKNKKRDGQRIVFIDGRGDRLRKELRFRIKMEYPTAEIEDASYAQYGGGATEVTIRRR